MSINRQNQEGEHLSAQGGLSLADILASLSYALDLTGGQPMGHAQRTCLIGMRLAQELGLTAEEQDSLYYALLVKDAGCSSNAARMCEIFGSDEIVAKRHSKLVDWSSRLDAARYAAAHTLPEGSLRERLRRLFHLAKTLDNPPTTCSMPAVTGEPRSFGLWASARQRWSVSGIWTSIGTGAAGRTTSRGMLSRCWAVSPASRRR